MNTLHGPGETKERRESSESTSKADALRLLHGRQHEIDEKTIASSGSIVVEKDIHAAGRRMEPFLAEQEKVRTKVRTPAEDPTLPQVVN